MNTSNPNRSKRLFCLITLVLSSGVGAAPPTWKGDFSTGDFSQYVNMHCGASNGAAACPGNNQSNPGSIAEHGSAPCSDSASCRLSILSGPAVPTPITGATSSYKPSNALKVIVQPAPDFQSRPNKGDNAWSYTPAYPWGFDHRNELVNASESSPNGARLGEYAQNDEHYWGFSVYIPNDGTFVDPGSFNTQNWHIVFQLHSVGQCDDGGPNMSLGVVRNDLGGFEAGPQYIFQLQKRDVYDSDNDRGTKNTLADRQSAYLVITGFGPGTDRAIRIQ